MKYLASFFLVLVACGTTRSSVQAPVDLTITPIGSAKLSAAGPPPDLPTTTCTLHLRAARIEKSQPGCYLDEQISREPGGTLRYPCSGDGPAEADFGAQRYRGKVELGDLELELATELDWEDGCKWGTAAVIRGLVTDKAGTPTHKKLAWRYHDHVITGRDCSGVCTAQTTIDVTAKSNAPKSSADEDDD